METVTLAGLKSRDERALELLIHTYERPLGRYLRSLTGTDDLAMDLLQETFLRAYVHAGELRHEAAVKTWLYRIATNLAWNALKRHRRFRWLPWQEWTAPSYTFEEQVAEQDRVRRAIGQLPPGYASCLLLTHVEGLKSHEAAAVLGLTPEAVRKRVSRAQEMLRAALGEEGSDAL